MIVRKTSIFQAHREEVFDRLRRLETLQYIASPYVTFEPVKGGGDFFWRVGETSSYRFRLFGVIPYGIHTIRIERFDIDGIRSREGNERVPIWNHAIRLRDLDRRTEYTDEVEIEAGRKTALFWLWAKAFYAHRQRKWIRLLEKEGHGHP